MLIVSFIKNNAVKSVAIAGALALLSFLMVGIIYNLKPLHSNSQAELSLPVGHTKSSNLPATNDAKETGGGNDTQTSSQLLNPESPCPPQQFSCMAKQNDNIQDQNCPSYKPIWVYFSQDKGASWTQVGCYATQIDAKKALSKAIANGYVKNNHSVNANDSTINNAVKSEVGISQTNNSDTSNATRTPANNNSIQDIFNNPLNKSQESETKSEKATDKAQASKATESMNIDQKTENKAESQANLTPVNEARESQAVIRETKDDANDKDLKDEKHQYFTAKFKLLFGLIPVEKRTYPNEEMREKALLLWKKEQKLLEPDGTINEKYAFKNHNENAMFKH